MPIPYRNQDELDDLGSAAFLKLQVDPQQVGYRGALFQVNAHGEPVEFTYNRLETPNAFLWREADLRRVALNRLTVGLLSVCPLMPRLLICLAHEVGVDLFGGQLKMDVPICFIDAPGGLETAEAAGNDGDLEEPGLLHLFWFPSAPAEDSAERRLFQQLARRGLLLEPFERAAAGLAEVYRRDEVAMRELAPNA